MPERVVILDRDGVINEDSDSYVKDAREWRPLPGSIDAIARLCHGGFRVCVATNQSGLGRGLFGLEQLNEMHRKLRELLAAQGGQVEMIAYCPHTPDQECGCRKPMPGLLTRIGERMGVSLVGLPFVGDSITDILAAKAAGMTPWLVLTGNGKQACEVRPELLAGVKVFSDLTAAADLLLNGGTRQ